MESSAKQFTELFKGAEIPIIDMRMFPSQYHSDATFFGPWFMVETSKGIFEIGWRKRVIHIDWSRTTLKGRGADVVANPGNTHAEKYVHAWDTTEAHSILRTLWRKG